MTRLLALTVLLLSFLAAATATADIMRPYMIDARLGGPLSPYDPVAAEMMLDF